MSLWLNRPQGSIETSPVQKLFNQMLEDFWDTRALPQNTKPMAGFSPKINVKESDHTLQVSAELPGMDEKDIDVSIDKQYLTISGEKKAESQRDEKGVHYYECSYGSFARKIPLPFEVNLEKVDASFKKGVLNIQLEKAEAAKVLSRKIPIQNRS